MGSKATFTQEELRARFNPDGSLLRRQQMIMLDMVTELDRICRKHDIPYFLFWGSLLGAVRHDGFIPWDDDLDVAMLRKDYMRLMKVLPDELPEHIVLQTNDTDRNYFYHFAKLRHRHSFVDEDNYDRVFKERGIFIDIFPLDRTHKRLHMLSEPLQGHCYKILRIGNDDKASMRKVRLITWFNRHVSFPFLRLIARITGGKTMMCDYGIPFHVEHAEEDFLPPVRHVFEGRELSIPANSHHILQCLYGDYMRLPDLDHLENHIHKLEIYDDRE